VGEDGDEEEHRQKREHDAAVDLGGARQVRDAILGDGHFALGALGDRVGLLAGGLQDGLEFFEAAFRGARADADALGNFGPVEVDAAQPVDGGLQGFAGGVFSGRDCWVGVGLGMTVLLLVDQERVGSPPLPPLLRVFYLSG
jgi:hypothetical protein